MSRFGRERVQTKERLDIFELVGATVVVGVWVWAEVSWESALRSLIRPRVQANFCACVCVFKATAWRQILKQPLSAAVTAAKCSNMEEKYNFIRLQICSFRCATSSNLPCSVGVVIIAVVVLVIATAAASDNSLSSLPSPPLRVSLQQHSW